MSAVGIIANPAAGKDIRRLVAQGRFIPDQEKVNILKRVMAGLDAVGVERAVMMPDSAMLGRMALESSPTDLRVDFLEMPVRGDEQDTSRAAGLMAGMGVGCVVTLGGDGTNRAVAKTVGDVPLVPISTGTNNVFPEMLEGTVAGLAAGVVARGLVDVSKVTEVSKRLEVRLNGDLADVALVDVAVSKEAFVGARAIWEMDTVHEVFLARTEPASIGLSAIGARLGDLSASGGGMYIRLGPGDGSVLAPIAPGTVILVPVREWRLMHPDEAIEVKLRPCTIALDGERAFSPATDETVSVSVSRHGPRVVDVEAALREAAANGIFTRDAAP